MKFAKSILTGTGSVVLRGLIWALLAPRAAHACVAFEPTGPAQCNLGNVPANTELVLQTVSFVWNGSAPLATLTSAGAGVAVETAIPLVSQAGTFIGTQPLTQYADPGTAPVCGITVSGGAADQMICSVIGYTISLP